MNLRVREPLIDPAAFDRTAEPPVIDDCSFDVPTLLRILYAHKTVIAGTVAAVLAVTIAALLVIVPVFNATALIMLDQRKNTVADVNAVLGELPTDSASIQNQIQIMTSRQLALRIVDKLKLDEDPEFNSTLSPGLFGMFAGKAKPGSAEGRDIAAAHLLKRINVDQVGLSTTMTLSVGSVDADKSARITNTMADAYVEDQLDAKFEATQRAAGWLTARVRQLASQVQSDDTAVQQYKAEHGIVDAVGGGSINDQQTINVSGQLINAKADLAQKVAAYERSLVQQRSGRASDVSQVLASPLIAQLRSQEADLTRQQAQLSMRYLSQHPKMIDIESQRRDTSAKIGAEIHRVIESLANDVAVARANVASLQQSLDQLQSKGQTQNSASIKLKALESIATSSRSMYEAVLSRLKEIQGQEGIATPDARVISRAVVPTVATPRAMSILGMAFPASLALGLVLAFLMEGMDSTFRTAEQVGKTLGLPVMATIPQIVAHPPSRNIAEVVVKEPLSSYAESIRGLSLSVAPRDAHGAAATKVVLLTSAVPGEGKTTVAIGLARLVSRSERRVLLIDGDFRRPAIAAAMGLTSPTGGIVEALNGQMPLDRCIMRDPLSNADVLACNGKPQNPSELIASNAMDRLIVDLRGKYDVIIIDSAPLLPVHDSLSLSRVSDTALLVAQSGKTQREAVTAALQSLRSMNAVVAGVVLTRAKIDPRRGYDSYLSPSIHPSKPADGATERRL